MKERDLKFGVLFRYTNLSEKLIDDLTIQIEEERVLNLLLKSHLNQTKDQRDISF